jgi:hypothetical protein
MPWRRIVEWTYSSTHSCRYSDWLRAEWPDLIPGRGWDFFSSLPRPDQNWGPPNLLSNWYRGSFSGLKRPGSEADHSPPFSARFENRVLRRIFGPKREEVVGGRGKLHNEEPHNLLELYLHSPKNSTGTTLPYQILLRWGTKKHWDGRGM